MAQEKIYASIIDEFLDDRKSDWEQVGLKDAQKSGEEVKEWGDKYVDESFLDDLADESHHTIVPPTSRSAVLYNRMAEKESALPRLSAGQKAATPVRMEDYKNERGDDESLFNEITMSIEQAEGKAPESKQYGAANRNQTDEEILRYVKKLLNQGVPPAKVAAQIEKLAEIELLDKKDNMGMNYLNQNQGTLGMAYLEPNTYMDDVSPTYGRNTASAEEGPKGKPFCSNCNKDVTPEKREANEYCPECKKILTFKPKTGARELSVPEKHQLAIAKKTLTYSDAGAKIMGGPTKEEAREIIRRLTGKPAKESSQKTPADCVQQYRAWKAAGIVPRAQSVKKVAACDGCSLFKNKTCNLYHLPVVANAQELAVVINRMTAGVPVKSKRAALIALANRQPMQVEVKKLGSRPVQKTSARTVESLRASREEPVSGFDIGSVETMHKRGVALDDIYKKGSLKVGSVQAGYAIKAFIASLREKGTKIALSQIDCTLLKQKLGMNNAIIGAVKCADCIYRQDMHCGLTGGTLVSFPGMEKTGKVAGEKPTDAVRLLKDYDLVTRPRVGDIDIQEPERLDVQMGSVMSAGDL